MSNVSAFMWYLNEYNRHNITIDHARFYIPTFILQKSKMADKDCHKWTLSVRFSQWEQPELFSRHFQDSKYVCEKNVFFGGRWSDFPTKLRVIPEHTWII